MTVLWSVMDFKGLKTTLDRQLMKGQLVYRGRVGSTGGKEESTGEGGVYRVLIFDLKT